MFKLPWISRKKHEEEIERLTRITQGAVQYADLTTAHFILQEAELNHYKQLFNEMQENQR